MKVRTIRKHNNWHQPVYAKNIGRKYDLPDRLAANLIATGLVEADDAAESED